MNIGKPVKTHDVPVKVPAWPRREEKPVPAPDWPRPVKVPVRQVRS